MTACFYCNNFSFHKCNGPCSYKPLRTATEKKNVEPSFDQILHTILFFSAWTTSPLHWAWKRFIEARNVPSDTGTQSEPLPLWLRALRNPPLPTVYLDTNKWRRFHIILGVLLLDLSFLNYNILILINAVVRYSLF